MAEIAPKYPIYIPSKGRADASLTARALQRYGVKFQIVVEPDEYKTYRERFDRSHLLVLPWNGKGVTAARCWIMEHSIAQGAERHWQLDDNIRRFRRWHDHRRIECNSGIALRVIEDFTDRYTNIALSGPRYSMEAIGRQPPFNVNVKVYSCTLVNNAIPHRWRLLQNEDTDLCLQVLADGWCTVIVNAFLAVKMPTMTIKGGNYTDGGPVSYLGDGRLQMARMLERIWPRVVTTKRRYGRPQHVVRSNWKNFTTPLILKNSVDLDQLPAVDNYGLTLKKRAAVEQKELAEYARRYGQRD